MAKTQLLICPYCGEAQPLSDRCRACKGLFEPLSRQATHNSMGPWFIRDPKRPHRPGCSYETLVRLVERQQLDRFSIIRGPTTRQFWAVAKRVPGVAHLLGYCHNCDAHVEPTSHGCPKCGMPFGAFLNRNHLGLPEIRPLPWEAELDLNDRKPMNSNGEGNGSASAHGLGAGAAARNVGISSFATDEELTGAAPGPQPFSSGSRVESRSASSTVSEEPEFVDVPGEEPGLREEAKAMAQAEPDKKAVATSAAPPAVETDRLTRTLRATVLKQRRTIRLLTIAVLIVAIGSAAFSMFLIKSTTGGDDAQDANTSSQHEQPKTNDDAPAVIAPAEKPAPTNDPAAPPAEEPKTAEKPSETPVDAKFAEALAGIEEARTLLAAAADDSRPLDDRIADCEKAVDLLEQAEKDVSGEALPPGFAEMLKKTRTDLERLRLSKFFP